MKGNTEINNFVHHHRPSHLPSRFLKCNVTLPQGILKNSCTVPPKKIKKDKSNVWLWKSFFQLSQLSRLPALFTSFYILYWLVWLVTGPRRLDFCVRPQVIMGKRGLIFWNSGWKLNLSRPSLNIDLRSASLAKKAILGTCVLWS